MTEPTEYPVDIPVTQKMQDRMRAAGWAPVTEDKVRLIADVINREGGTPGSSLHSWRCEYPERYGPCECAEETAREILRAIAEPIA